MKKNFHVTMADGTELKVHSTVADFARYDVQRAHRGWPVIAEAGFLYVAFVAWAALRRTKQTDENFDDWLEVVDTVDPFDSEDELNPTTATASLTD